MGFELHPVTSERIVSVDPSCCMCYLFFSAGPFREEGYNKLDGLGYWNTGFTEDTQI